MLVDAGYPNGFKLEIAFTPAATAGTHGDIATMMAGFFEDVGVELELKSLENTASLRSALASLRRGPAMTCSPPTRRPTIRWA